MSTKKSQGGEVIFTKTIRLRNGKVIHASAYGLNAFRIVVKKKRS